MSMGKSLRYTNSQTNKIMPVQEKFIQTKFPQPEKIKLEHPHLYSYQKENKDYIIGKVHKNDQEFIQTLLNNKAVLTGHQINAPQYKSWTQIQKGLKFILETEHYILEYVPQSLFALPENYTNKTKDIINNTVEMIMFEGTYTFSKKLRKKFNKMVLKENTIIIKQIEIQKSLAQIFEKPLQFHDTKTFVGSNVSIKNALEKSLQSAINNLKDNYVKDIIRENNILYKMIDEMIQEVQQINIINKTITQKLKNIAPLSEQGKLQIQIKTDKQAVIQELEKISIFLSSTLSEYKAGYIHIYNEEQYLKTPKGFKIIHGMTGVKTTQQAYNRLKEMTRTQGILSQAERRTQEINIKTMSPIGDIASGIDWAVPATINEKPSYGEYIFFVMNKKILQRQKMFFAPKDFGGGKNRLPNYNRYARQLGQKDIFTPMTAQQKQLHLNTLGSLSWLAPCKKPFNEVWFEHSICWSEIDYIVVHPQIYEQTTELIKNTPITAHIQVQKSN